jgi:hypothetical protein
MAGRAGARASRDFGSHPSVETEEKWSAITPTL